MRPRDATRGRARARGGGAVVLARRARRARRAPSSDASSRARAQIFAYFIEVEEGQTEEEAYEVEITPAQFKDALDRLCPNVFNVTDKELAGLIAEFDTDGNGTISISEFRDFCYRIPHLAWKAERMRYERSAQEEGRSVSVRPTKGSATPGRG